MSCLLVKTDDFHLQIESMPRTPLEAVLKAITPSHWQQLCLVPPIDDDEITLPELTSPPEAMSIGCDHAVVTWTKNGTPKVYAIAVLMSCLNWAELRAVVPL